LDALSRKLGYAQLPQKATRDSVRIGKQRE